MATMLGLGLGLTFGGMLKLSGSQLLLGRLGDTDGLAIDFATDQSITIHDAGTPANNYASSGTVSSGALVGPGHSLTYASPSPKLTMQSTGYLAFGAHNLLTYSEQFDNAAWSIQGGSVTANNLLAPNGTLTADTLTDDSTTNIHMAMQSYSAVAGLTYVASVSARYIDNQYAAIRFYDSSITPCVTYDLVNGTVTHADAGISGTITSLGGGWYRLSATFTATATGTGNVLVAMADSSAYAITSYLGTGKSVGLFGAQLSKYPCVTDYIATTSAAIYSLPYEYNTSGVCQGVKVEEARTNLLTYSNAFSNAAWTKSNGAITAGTGTILTGTTPEKFTASGGSGIHALRYSSFSGTNGSTYTFSVVCKAADSNCIGIIIYNTGSGIGTVHKFNLATGVELTPETLTSDMTIVGKGITSLGGGWYRVYTTITVTSTTTYDTIIYALQNDGTRVYTPSGTAESLYIQHAQAELGATPSSVILTGSASVTRAQDDLRIATTSFPASLSTVTMYANFSTATISEALTVCDNAGQNFIVIDATSPTGGRTFNYGNNVGSSALTGTINASPSFSKAAVALAVNDLAFSCNGAAVTTAADGKVLTTQTRLAIGQHYAGTTRLVGYIKQVLYLPRRASNAELQTLTT